MFGNGPEDQPWVPREECLGAVLPPWQARKFCLWLSLGLQCSVFGVTCALAHVVRTLVCVRVSHGPVWLLGLVFTRMKMALKLFCFSCSRDFSLYHAFLLAWRFDWESDKEDTCCMCKACPGYPGRSGLWGYTHQTPWRETFLPTAEAVATQQQ